jgi:hypothetical protein
MTARMRLVAPGRKTLGGDPIDSFTPRAHH